MTHFKLLQELIRTHPRLWLAVIVWHTLNCCRNSSGPTYTSDLQCLHDVLKAGRSLLTFHNCIIHCSSYLKRQHQLVTFVCIYCLHNMNEFFYWCDLYLNIKESEVNFGKQGPIVVSQSNFDHFQSQLQLSRGYGLSNILCLKYYQWFRPIKYYPTIGK